MDAERARSVASAALVGRDVEISELVDALDVAAGGSPRLMLVRGEAGVGKTTLVRRAAERARTMGCEVLWGSGLRLAMDHSPYVSLAMAFQRRLAEPDDGARVREALMQVPGAGWLVPGGVLDEATTPSATGGSISLAGALLFRLASTGPVLLVVDDVQWADPATRDVLAYLVAGFAGQPLAVIAIFREEQAGPTEAFGLWLADMRRMPGVQDLNVQRLARDACDAQVRSVLGIAASPHLLGDVFRRSQGNPYLTDLLLTDIRSASRIPDSLPSELPSALSDALLAAWARLSVPAQELSRVLAVGGSPAVVVDLEHATGMQGGTVALSGALTKGMTALHEAMAAGIVILDGDAVWFRHPLLADVLVATYLPGEAAPVHAAWAGVLESGGGEGLSPLRRETALARHHAAAGQPDEAFVARLRAAELAEQQGEVGTAADHLVSAVELWELRSVDAFAAPPAAIELVDLLESAAFACMRSDRAETAHQLLTRAFPLVEDPLRTSRFIVELAELEWDLGLVEQRTADRARAAVELARTGPESVELAEALSYLVYRLLWDAEPDEAARTAQEAYEVAVRSGSRSARSQALGALSITESDPVRALALGKESLSDARASGDDRCIMWAYDELINLHMRQGLLHEARPVLEEACAHAIANGRGAWESAALADMYLTLGDLDSAADALRDALARRGAPVATVLGRLVAASVAVRRGDLDAARQHRVRALEVMPNLEHRTGGLGTAALAELYLAEGDPTAVMRLVSDAIPELPNHHLEIVDELFMWGVRAVADLASNARDRRDERGLEAAHAAYERIVQIRATFTGQAFARRSPDDQVQPALGALFAAERQRLLAVTDEDGDGDDGRVALEAAWRHAAEMCSGAGLRWFENHARWRLGTVLVTGEGATPEAKRALRSAYAYAVQQGAAPLRRAIEEAAALGRIQLDVEEANRTTTSVSSPAGNGPLAQLTKREREVLAQLIANRTYAEIAAALFISEKTVSVHISNMLRKTNTASRRELAALAIRLDSPTGPGEG